MRTTTPSERAAGTRLVGQPPSALAVITAAGRTLPDVPTDPYLRDLGPIYAEDCMRPRRPGPDRVRRPDGLRPMALVAGSSAADAQDVSPRRHGSRVWRGRRARDKEAAMSVTEAVRAPEKALLEWLATHGVDYELTEHPVTITARETARVEGLDPRRFAKTLGVETADG